MSETHHQEGAPADAAGHVGSKTVPQDVQTPSGPGASGSEDRRVPTNQDTSYRGSPKGGWFLPITLALVFLLLVFAFARF